MHSDVCNDRLGPLWEIMKGLSIPYIDCAVQEGLDIGETVLADRGFHPDHIILLPPGGNGNRWWVYYAVGYAKGLGNMKKLCIVTDEEFTEDLGDVYIPKGATISSSVDELRMYLLHEIEHSKQTQRETQAKKNIIQAGLALRSDSFGDCVQNGEMEHVKWFIDAGYSPDITNQRGVPMLNLAIRSEQNEVFEYLLDLGADVNGISGDNGNTPLMEAVVIRDEKALKKLLEENCNVNVQNKNGQTALIIGVGNGYAEIVEDLIRKNVDMSISDNLGMTARKYAELFHHSQILALLDPGLAS